MAAANGKGRIRADRVVGLARLVVSLARTRITSAQARITHVWFGDAASNGGLPAPARSPRCCISTPAAVLQAARRRALACLRLRPRACAVPPRRVATRDVELVLEARMAAGRGHEAAASLQFHSAGAHEGEGGTHTQKRISRNRSTRRCLGALRVLRRSYVRWTRIPGR